jgi:hypothetical protein
MLGSNALLVCKQMLESGLHCVSMSQLIDAGLTPADALLLSDPRQLEAAIAYINSQLVKPNAEQRALLDHLVGRVMNRTTIGHQQQLRGNVETEHLLILGGPGVGNLHFVERLIVELESHGIGCSLG